MKERILIFLIGILLNPMFLLAQEEQAPKLDTIYLKNGGMMAGKMLRYHPRRGAVLEKSYGTYTTITADNIRSIQLHSGKASKENAKLKIPSEKPYNFRETGFYFTVMGSMLNGIDPAGEKETGFGLEATTGYMFHRLVGVGLGVGFDTYSIISNNAPAIFPVSMEVRGYLIEQNWSPYYALRAGYGLAAKDEERNINEARGGAMLHPAFGLRLGAREDVNFALDVGYRFQRATVERDVTTWRREIQEQRIWYKRLTVRFGILF